MRVELLRWLAVGQAGVALLLIGIVLAHAVGASARARHRHAPRRAASAALARMLAGDGDLPAAVAVVGDLPRRDQAELVADVARSLRGAQREQLTAVADAVGLVAHAERWCASRRRVRRLRGVRLLSAVGALPGALSALLVDPWAPVRAEAASVAGAHPAPERLDGLLALLGDPAPLVRFAAKDALVRCGAGAADALVPWLEAAHTDVGVLADALDVAVPLAGPAFGATVGRQRAHPDARVRARVATLAAGVGGQASLSALDELLDDPEPDVRAAAAAGLGHLGHWPGAPRLARLLRDPAWAVRRAAGLALRRLDAPGALLLRRALHDRDPFARDMARQVLDLPDLRAAAG